jgi:hypothetical protein
VRRSIYLWDGLSGESLGQLSGHDDAIYTLERFQTISWSHAHMTKPRASGTSKPGRNLHALRRSQLVPTLAINDGRVAMYNGTRIQVADVRDYPAFHRRQSRIGIARYQNRIQPLTVNGTSSLQR